METQTVFYEMLAQPEAGKRVKALLKKGLHMYGDAELNLGKYL